MDWIEDQLNHARAPETIVHLGAGLCRELPHYVNSGARRIVLVEPNPEVLPELKARADSHANVEVLSVAVSAQEGKKALKIYNYPDLSSLRRPTGLFQLLPGLQQTDQTVVDVVGAEKLPAQLGLEGSEDNWLVIDTPGEESAVVSALAHHEQLHHFDRIILRAGAESFYDGAVTAKELADQLEKLGYYLEGAGDSADSDWPRSHLRLNAKALECRRLRRESETLADENKRLKAQSQEISEHLKRSERRSSDLAEELRAANKQQQEIEKNAEELNARLSRIAEEKASLEGEVRRLKEQLDQQPSTAKLLSGIQKTLSREIQQSRVQLESYMALNKYLDYGELTPALHGWTISPDLAMYLVQLLENENYDLIIEFGSGSSTVLLAQAMEQRATRMPKIGQLISHVALEWPRANQASSARTLPESSSTSQEIQNRIIAFEHSRTFFEKTEKLLQQAGVAHIVDLSYAPLREFSYCERSYLFYDCVSSLQRATNLLPRERSKILVLVDGPPGSTNLFARYPALPIVLEVLSGHEIHLVLDDYNRSQEAEIVELWKSDLQRISLEFKVETLPLEKGACVLRVH